MLHRPFPATPIRETLEALTAEVKAGRIRTLGCSNFSAELLREATETAGALGLSRFESTQPPFNLADAAARDELLPYCQQENIATITYSPLAAGFLAGKYSPGSAIPKGTRFDVVPGHIDVYFNERSFHVVERLRQLSAETGRSLVDLAMAWVLQQPGVTSVLVGARHRGQLDNALAALARPIDQALNDRMTEWLYEAFGPFPRLTALAGAINHPRFKRA
jgi:aryl-alcohol dehydrogenase-like predicted oxidoreductase